MNGKVEFGDYQTPEYFAKEMCNWLSKYRKINPKVIIEPTCGIGNILKSSLLFNADKYYGFDINSDYCDYCKQHIEDTRVNIINKNIYDVRMGDFLTDLSDVLVIGNPPWVTNSMLSALNSVNLPVKRNLKKLRGIEAITGDSNFDICESIILQMIDEFKNTNTAIAMLCKESVARNIFMEINRRGVNFEYCDIFKITAKKIFNVNVAACMLVVKLSKISSDSRCDVYTEYDWHNKKCSLVYNNGIIKKKSAKIMYDLDGKCCFVWRQGIKHDCAKIMELSLKDSLLYNGNNELVDIESELLFPLIKSSMFKKYIINNFDKYVIVTQRKLKEDTCFIKEQAKKTWMYLNSNIDSFAKRKSSIYVNAPKFSMFGIGEYTYFKYKVGISGFYKKPIFSLLYSHDGKAVMLDDTSYFIGFDKYDDAYVTMLILNTDIVCHFLLNIAFLDAKRPYTKKILSRIDFNKIFNIISYEILKETEKKLNIKSYITEVTYRNFIDKYKIIEYTQQSELNYS